MKKVLYFSFLLFLLLVPNNAFAINEVNVYFFHSNNCDICKQEKVYLDALKQRYPNMKIYSYEINESNNNEIMEQAKKLYGETRTGVPYTVIGDRSYLGFSQSSKAIFQKRVYEYSKNSYQNKLGQQLGISYRNDLEGEVQEYKDNSDYQIEESSGNTRVPSETKQNTGYDKYEVSMYLIGAGVILALIAYFIHIFEKRRGI